MKSSLKKNLQILITGVLAVIGCIGLLLASSLIPQSRIKENAEKSAMYFTSKDLFEMLVKKQEAAKRDNYADVVSFGIAYQLGNTSARKNAAIRILEARYTQDTDSFENADEGFKRAVCEDAPGNLTYSRYWHGGAAVIRLLLMFTEVSGMRVLFFVIGTALNLAWIVFLVIRKEYMLAVPYLFGVIAGKILFGYTCFEYAFVCLFVTVFSFVIYLIMSRNEKEPEHFFAPEAVFLAAGILTCFFDFLTAETATFTIPAFVSLYLLEKARNKPVVIRKEGEKGNTDSPWLFLLRTGLFWLAGYAFMFLLKWGLCAAFLGPEEARIALSSVAERTVGAVHETGNLSSETVGPVARLAVLFERNFACLYGIPNDTSENTVRLILFGTPAVLYIAWFFLRDREVLNHKADNHKAGNHKKDNHKKGKKENSFFPAYLVLALVPIARFLILSNHAYVHYFFTYRALMIVVMVIVYLFIKTTVLYSLLKSR